MDNSIKDLIMRAALFLLIFLASADAFSAHSQSKFMRLATDVQVSANTALLTTTVTLTEASHVYVQADGRYYPGPPTSKGLANAYILINGSLVSNESIIDWRNSNSRKQHSFNAIGAAYLQAGTHTVGLYGAAVGTSVYFGAESGLSVLVKPATSVLQYKVPGDTVTYNFNTAGVGEGVPIPNGTGRATVLSSAAIGAGPVIAMASGRSYMAGAYGDPMWGMFLNNTEPNIDSMTWTMNDIYTEAELQAPFYSQALFHPTSGNNTIQLIASEATYSGNNVRYKIGGGTTMVLLAGGMNVVGKGLDPAFSYSTNGFYKRFAYKCVGTNGFLPSCPPAGSEVIIGQGQICIPNGHNGIVLVSSKTRIQGDPADPGGTVYLYIKVDGARVGTLGVQGLGPAPNAVSTRTLSASYLAAGANTLSPGCHTVQAVGVADGNFRHVMMNSDMPVVWFD